MVFTHTLTHTLYPVALPQTQVRFVPDNIDGPRFDPRTVGQSVPDSVRSSEKLKMNEFSVN